MVSSCALLKRKRITSKLHPIDEVLEKILNGSKCKRVRFEQSGSQFQVISNSEPQLRKKRELTRAWHTCKDLVAIYRNIIIEIIQVLDGIIDPRSTKKLPHIDTLFEHLETERAWMDMELEVLEHNGRFSLQIIKADMKSAHVDLGDAPSLLEAVSEYLEGILETQDQ